MAVRNRTKTFGVSLLLHAVAIALLAVMGSGRMIDRKDPPIEFEIIAPVPYEEPKEEVPEPPKQPDAPPVPEVKRPEVVPKKVKQVVRDEPRPFQDNAVTAENPRPAPDDVEAVPTPTTPVPEIAMESFVGATTETDYVTTSSDVGSVPVREGPGGGRGGAPGSGAPGNQANQDAVDIEVSRDWEITQLPEPINDRDFEPIYPPTARREKREAVVIVELLVDDGGSVAKASVVDGPGGGHGFERAAIAYAKRLRFEPALAGDRPVASRIDWSVHFYVRN